MLVNGLFIYIILVIFLVNDKKDIIYCIFYIKRLYILLFIIIYTLLFMIIYTLLFIIIYLLLFIIIYYNQSNSFGS